jgi:hypothetical protein
MHIIMVFLSQCMLPAYIDTCMHIHTCIEYPHTYMQGLCDVVGFEPIAGECEKLNAQSAGCVCVNVYAQMFTIVCMNVRTGW